MGLNEFLKMVDNVHLDRKSTETTQPPLAAAAPQPQQTDTHTDCASEGPTTPIHRYQSFRIELTATKVAGQDHTDHATEALCIHISTANEDGESSEKLSGLESLSGVIWRFSGFDKFDSLHPRLGASISRCGRSGRTFKRYVHPAGNIGESGIVRNDGTTEIFTPEFAHDILMIGPAGIITKSGRNVQLTEDLRLVVPTRAKRSPTSYKDPRGTIGTAGIHRPDGSTELFTHDFAHDILLIGPAGIVTKSGRNIQITEDLRLVVPGLPAMPSRKKRSPTSYKDSRGIIGTAGILRKDGSTELFTHEFAHDILLIGPAGIITKSGRNLQLTDDFRLVTPVVA
ncbi:uncharacterized protein LOC135216476 [Macrobrachium nipponense]|uniref:uncharacterized protein LOC135216476 n=1 Tax=Macrobrachium nipponense TaxID=159736 RepID=UPI0030C8B97E